MPRTATERRILEERKARGILVPILESTLEHPLQVEDEKDEWFILELMRARAKDREKGVFSPSMLSSCLRQSYFAVTGVEKQPAANPRANAYFLDGDFRHYKWQFALWKAHRAGLLKLLGVEVRVYHSQGDFAGTIDAVTEIDNRIFVDDFKGMHVRYFQEFEQKGTSSSHRLQIVGYAMILEKGGGYESFLGYGVVNAVSGCLLIGENKAGPTQRGSPIALHEDFVSIASGRSKVKNRLRVLRDYRDRKEIPSPDCTSTRINQFQQCPFLRLCRDEVKQIQRERERDARARNKELRPATPRR